MATQVPVPGDTVTTVLGERVFADAVRMSSSLTVTGAITGGSIVGSPFVAAPASAVAAGTTGQLAFDATHLYVCIATNTWVRGGLATW